MKAFWALAMANALAGSACGAHRSPTSRAFWGPGHERKAEFESPQAEFQHITVAMPLVTYSLDNGLRVIQHEDHRVPIVTFLVEYDVGSFDDPGGSGGIAHLTEHLLFRGSRNVQDGTFVRALEQVGATRINGMTRDETTRYTETLPANQLELALWMESDRLAFPFERLDAAKFATEKRVVENELRDFENRPYSRVYEFVRRALYPAGHPYHDAPIVEETLANLDAIKLDDVRRFFHDHYGPNHATIVLAGDFKNEQAKAMVAKYFAALAPGRASLSKPRPREALLDHQVMLRIEAQVAAPVLVVSWSTVAEFAPDDAELDILATLLSRGGRQLAWKLTDEHKVASTFVARQFSRRLGSTFVIEATLKSVSDFDRALSIIDEALDKLRAERPGPNLTEVSKFPWAMRLLFQNESLSGRSASFLSYRRMAGDPAFLSQDLARYAAVDAEGVQRVARLLERNNRVVAMVIPTTGAPAGGALAAQ